MTVSGSCARSGAAGAGVFASVALLLCLRGAVAGSLPDGAPATVSADGNHLESQEQALVIACNAWADKMSARVGVRPLPQHHKAPHAPLRGARRLRRRHSGGHVSMLEDDQEEDFSPEATPQGHAAGRHAVAAAALKDALWSRPLEYGECAEYHVDLRHRQLFFVTPMGADVCKLAQMTLVKMTESDLESDEAKDIAAPGEPPKRLTVVLSQPKATSSSCSLQAQALTHRLSRYGETAAELAVIDAYSQSDGPEMIVVDGENATLPPLDASAVVRLEDIVSSNIIASENLASRTLGFGAEYAVEPKNLHVILEDLRGSTEFGHKDISFKPDHTYVAIRIGKSGDADFQPQLLFYESKDGTAEAD